MAANNASALTATLSAQEWETIQSALYTVSPTGGGSAPFCLMLKLGEMLGISSNEALIERFSNTVVEEWKAFERDC